MCQICKSSSFKSDQIVLKKAFFTYDSNRENLFAFQSKDLGTCDNFEINALFIGKNKKSCEPHVIINCFKSVCYVPHIHINSLMGRGEYFGYSVSVG